MRAVAPAIFVPTGADPAIVTEESLKILVNEARENGLGKARLLLHRDPSATLHEMLIVHAAGRYIRPHRNDASAKSYLVVAGLMRVIWFEPEGHPAGQTTLGAPGSGLDFMLRFDAPVFHTLLPMTETVVFIETILGPHRATTYARWAPEPGAAEAERYFEELRRDTGL